MSVCGRDEKTDSLLRPGLGKCQMAIAVVEAREVEMMMALFAKCRASSFVNLFEQSQVAL